MNKKLIVIILMSLPWFATANSGGTGWRNITSLGCHLTDGTCYFNIDGAPVGAESCTNNNVRFDVLNSPNGKTWLSLLQQAYASKTRVSLNINACYGNSNYPTFNYGAIEK